MAPDRLKRLLFTVGRPFSPIYAQLMTIRSYLYARNVLKQSHFEVPVVSAGNLTMGGTGKTPLVIYIANYLRKKGYRPAVVSRGYRGTAKGRINIVSDGSSVLLDPEQAGDEPYLIACRAPGVVVATGKNRRFPCRYVIDEFSCDVIVLDDGFQHLSVARTLDLVLFDAEHFAGNSRVFPGGDLREPISALQRGDAFILTGVSEKNRPRAYRCQEALRKILPDKKHFYLSRSFPHALRTTFGDDGKKTDLIALADIPEKLFCFCGIAQPQRFLTFAEENGISITASRFYSDHHHYAAEDLEAITKHAAASGGSGLLTTEKDLVKLQKLEHCSLTLYTPVLDIEPNPEFEEFICSGIGGDSTR